MADRPIVEGIPKGTEKMQRVIEHLQAKEAGDPIPYFRDETGRLRYLDRKGVNKRTGEVSYGFVDLSKKLEREARFAAQQLELTPQLSLYQEIYGEDVGRQVFLDELSKSRAIFDTTDSSLYDIDHMGSKRFKYPHLARNLNPQLSVYNRSEGARELTPEQETALRVVRDDLRTTLQLQGPELNQQQKDLVMGRDAGGQSNAVELKQMFGQIRLGRVTNPIQTIAETMVTSMANLQEMGINPLQATTQAMLGRSYDEDEEIKVPSLEQQGPPIPKQ
tara:strand:+ start:47 stop:874 length:828 start_codon:yes stop_codon:yes gene_type:complete